MGGATWSHRLARIVVKPLIGTGVTPNHLTILRLVTGVLACSALMAGQRFWNWWGGGLWLLSAFLDRADGELARMGGMCTAGGHRFDYVADNLVNAGVFITVGIGLRHSALGGYAVGLGLWTGVSLFICGHWSEALEMRTGPESKAYSGAFGFDPDDLLYLLSPIIWLGWQVPLLVAASLGATFMTALTGWRLRRLLARTGNARIPDQEIVP